MINKEKINIRLLFVLLILSMLIGGWFSVLLGKELCWDLANYHYYTPYAFFHHRQQIDFWPASFVHQYLNPTIDFLTYFLINSFSPRLTEFILGALHSINFWLLFLIVHAFLQGRFKIYLALLLAFLGIYGPTALPGMGSFQNDNLISLFVLSFVLLQVHVWQNYSLTKELSKKKLFLSGLLLGIGIGLKLTASVFVVGAFITTFILPLRKTDRLIALFFWNLALLVGFALFASHWMIVMWQQHHNPFFPFFNQFFHSPDFPAINWRDTRFFPRNFWQTLFFPFYFSWDGRTADGPFRDIRFLLVYVFFVLAGIKYAWEKWQQRASTSKKINLEVYWLFAFFIFSYMTWQYYFSIARYLVALEMLSPLVIYLLIKKIFTHTHVRCTALSIIFYTMVLLMAPIPLIRTTDYNTTFFNMKLPSFIEHTPQATVLIAYPAYVMDSNPRPQSYLIPFFPHGWRFIGIPFWHEKYLDDKKTTEELLSQLKKQSVQSQPFFLLTSNLNMNELYRTAHRFGLKAAGQCEYITNDRQKVSNQQVLLCPVVLVHSSTS